MRSFIVTGILVIASSVSARTVGCHITKGDNIDTDKELRTCYVGDMGLKSDGTTIYAKAVISRCRMLYKEKSITIDLSPDQETVTINWASGIHGAASHNIADGYYEDVFEKVSTKLDLGDDIFVRCGSDKNSAPRELEVGKEIPNGTAFIL